MNRTASRHQAPSHRQDAGPLTGVRPLLQATIRQDARNIAPWVVLTSVLSVSSILIYLWLFPDPADRIGLSATLGANPALSLIFGPARDLMTDDGFNAWRAGQLGAFFAALMAILIVVRNSRAHEDSGQAELFASGVMARSARLAVAVIMAALASLALGVVSFTLTVLVGGGVLPTLILSASYVASGLMFAGVAAVAAQLGADSRAAASLAVAILGVLYVVRGYIDSAGLDPWVSWLTPLGWLAHTAPATENNPWPLLLALAFAVVLVLIAFGLENRRDFGRGLIAGRHGPERAGLAGSVRGLAVQLHRGALMSWGIAFVALGVLFGTLITAIGELIASNRSSSRCSPVARSTSASGSHSSSCFRTRRDHRCGRRGADRHADPCRGGRLPGRAAPGRIPAAGHVSGLQRRRRVPRPGRRDAARRHRPRNRRPPQGAGHRGR